MNLIFTVQVTVDQEETFKISVPTVPDAGDRRQTCVWQSEIIIARLLLAANCAFIHIKKVK